MVRTQSLESNRVYSLLVDYHRDSVGPQHLKCQLPNMKSGDNNEVKVFSIVPVLYYIVPSTYIKYLLNVRSFAFSFVYYLTEVPCHHIRPLHTCLSNESASLYLITALGSRALFQTADWIACLLSHTHLERSLLLPPLPGPSLPSGLG